MTRTSLGKKIPVCRWALSIGLSSSLIALGAASAQQAVANAAAAPETAEADRVIVTGSNIPTSEEVGANPVDTIDQQAIQVTGQQDVLSALQRSTPAISGGGSFGQSVASTDSADTYGASTVSIHGLSTLILLDGRRVASASAAAAGGVSGVDLELFPTALIKSIEVLKDGASAIYGTDAIGGVINVILNQDFTGFDFTSRYGFAEKGDIHDQRYDGVVGLGDDKTKIVLGVQYVEQDPLFARQRDFTQSPPANLTYTVPGQIFDPTTGNPYYLNPSLTSPFSKNPVKPGLPVGVSGLAPGTYVPGAATLPGNTLTDITLDQNRLNFVGTFERQLLDKYVVAFGDFIYAKDYSQSYLNGQPLYNGDTDGFGDSLTVPANAPYNPFRQVFNGASVNGAVYDRFQSNPRIFRNDTNFFRVVAGLKGEIIKDLTYEVAVNTSEDETNYKNFNLVNAVTFEQAVSGGYNAAGVAVPGGVNAATGVVTPAGKYSMVAGNLQPAIDLFSRTNPASALAGIYGTDQRDLVTKLEGVDGRLTYFTPFNLPAGPIGMEAGGEWREEKLRAIFSPEVFFGSVPGADINKARDVVSGQGEIQFPIVSSDMKIPGIYSLDLDFAGRYDSYTDTPDSAVPKVSVLLRPIKDVALRASYSQSYIAPTLFDEFGPTSSGFSNQVTLPGDAAGTTEQSQERGGSNPNLKSSSSDNYSAGIVISPHFVPGLTINGDFFHVDQRQEVGVIPDTTIINSVNTLGPASPYAGLIRLGSYDGSEVTAPGQLQQRLTKYYLTDNELNIGGSRVGGVDFGINYNIDLKTMARTTADLGQLTLNLQGVYYFQFKDQIAPTLPYFDTVGYLAPPALGGPGDAVPQYHLTPSISYTWGGATASALGNYSPSLRNALNSSAGGEDITTYQGVTKDGYFPEIRDYYTIDLLFSYEFGLKKPAAEAMAPPSPKEGKDAKGGDDKAVAATSSKAEVHEMLIKRFLDGFKISFGINNVTNAKPPLVIGSTEDTNTDAALYDPYQRYYYVTVEKKF
jgi:iron complex outermembrane receptor protein